MASKGKTVKPTQPPKGRKGGKGQKGSNQPDVTKGDNSKTEPEPKSAPTPSLSKTDPFWSQSSRVDYSLWNANSGYELFILKKEEPVYETDAFGVYKTEGASENRLNATFYRGRGHNFTDSGFSVERRFTFSVNPQEITFSMPMAISTTPTFGGIVEEHNAAPFRNIVLSGTTGVNPARGSAKSIKSYTEVTQSIQASIESSQQPRIQSDSFQDVARPDESGKWLNVEPDSRYRPGQRSESERMTEESREKGNRGDLATSTGYAQFRSLQRFLEDYVLYKKQKAGSSYRLGFAMWKDQAFYLVTPLQFEVKRSAASPLEYMYSLQLKAWKRIDLGQISLNSTHQIPQFSSGYFRYQLPQAQQTKNFLDDAYAFYLSKQRSYNEAMNAIGKAQEISRIVVGYMKVALNAALFVSDLSPELLIKLGEEEAMRWARLFGYEPSLITKAKRLSNNVYFSMNPTQITTIGVSNVVINARKQQSLSASTGTQVEVDSLELSPTLLDLIEEERQSYRALTRLDFESMRNELMASMATFSASIGLSTENETANESTTQTTGAVATAATTEPTELDYQTLFQMNRLAMVLNSMAVSNNVNVQQVTPMDYVAGLATQSSIAFKVPKSKFGVPFPYGYTLEQLARDYLDNPNRWMEIATLNGLQAPYVDEVGVEVPLVVNGAERTLVVELPADATISRGQAITIAATGVPREKRYVQQVEKRDTLTIIRVDGESDLGKFTLNGQASVHFYRSNTVNSQMMIYIPSDNEPNEQDYATKSIPGLANLQQMIAAGGVDLQLTNSMDLAVTPDGDCKLAIGLTNLIQRVRIAFSTPPGGLLQHPDFGLGLVPGVSTADLTAQSVLDQAQAYFQSDSAFSGVESVFINKTGPSLAISMSLGVRGVDQLLPVTLEVKQ